MSSAVLQFIIVLLNNMAKKQFSSVMVAAMCFLCVLAPLEGGPHILFSVFWQVPSSNCTIILPFCLIRKKKCFANDAVYPNCMVVDLYPQLFDWLITVDKLDLILSSSHLIMHTLYNLDVPFEIVFDCFNKVLFFNFIRLSLCCMPQFTIHS